MGIYTRNGLEFEFNFYTSLRAVDKMRFVSGVTDLVVGDNYNSVIRDMMFNFNIISIFTDVDISDITNPENNDAINMIEDLINDTNIVEIVIENAQSGLIAELNKAVDDNIEYLTGIHKNPLTESLSNIMNTIERKLNDVDVDSMMELAQIFGGMTGELTPEKMLEAYEKSDLFKKSYREMLANREQHKEEIEYTGKSVKSVTTKK
ncbi:MAG: hypothetical protein IKW51_08980 [Bacteroidales bacterium]|nr:hypothetical protein [Bacteroidales bacterium]